MNKMFSTKIRDIGKVLMCKRVLNRQTSKNGDIPFFKISTFGQEPKDYISKELYQTFKENYNHPKTGDILISAAGTIGKTVIYDGKPAYFQDSNIVWIDNDETKVTNQYLYYFYQTEPWLPTDGSTIKRLYNDNLRNLIVNYPCLEKQKQISKVLSDLDAKIEVNNQINAKLEAMAKTLYEYWFVQFDFPFDFAQGKPLPNATSSGVEKPYKSSGGKMVYNEELKQEIPEGWEVKTIKDLIKSDKNGDWGKADHHNNYVKKVNCIRGADLNGLNGQGNTNSPTRFILEKNEHKLLNSGDFIIEISGGSPIQSTGRIGMVIYETFERFDSDLICSNFCRAISLNDEYFTFNFLQFWNRIYRAGVLFGWEGKTSGIKNFLFDNFISKYKIPVPNKDLTKAYYDAVKPYYSKIQKNLVENQKLAELRDWLLPMLMNGQVSVEEVQDYDYQTQSNDLGMVAEDKD